MDRVASAGLDVKGNNALSAALGSEQDRFWKKLAQAQAQTDKDRAGEDTLLEFLPEAQAATLTKAFGQMRREAEALDA